MSPKEWSKAFEQVFHRKPSAEEFSLAKANGFPEINLPNQEEHQPVSENETHWTSFFKKFNKEALKIDKSIFKRKDSIFLLVGLGIALVLIIVGSVTLYGWSKEDAERERRIEEASLRAETEAELDQMLAGFEEQEAEVEKKAEEEKKKAAEEEKRNNDPLKGKWNHSKKQALSTEMVKFGNIMNQPGYRDITSEFSGKINMVDDSNGNSPVDIELSSDGSGDSEYRCLAVYIYQSGSVLHRYFFSIRSDGSNLVLYSKDPVGTSEYHVHVTENTDLFSAWGSVVGG